MAERSPEERKAVNELIAKEVYKVAEKRKLAIYSHDKSLKKLIQQAFNPKRQVELKNFFVPSPTPAPILQPESSRDIMYFINDFAKDLFSKYHYIADTELSVGRKIQGASQPSAMFKSPQACGEEMVETFRTNVEEKFLYPYPVEAKMRECWKRFVDTGQHYFLTDDDLSQSPEFNYFMQTLIADRIFADMLRLFWFGGYNSPFWSTPPADLVGTTQSYFISGNGLWLQIEGDTTIPYVNIPENAGLTFAAQIMTPQAAFDLIGNCLASLSMRANNYDVHVSPYVFRALARNLEIQTNFNTGGLKVVKFDEEMTWGESGVKIINRKDWGYVTETFMSDGTRYHLPNRVLVYERENIACAYHEDILNKSAFRPLGFNRETQIVYQYINLIFDATYLPSAGLDMVKAY